MTNLSLQEKNSIICGLETIMYADSIIHPNEEKYLEDTLDYLKISKEDIAKLNPMSNSLCKSYILNMPDTLQRQIKKLFVGMAEADGYVDPREIEAINRFFE